MDVQEISAVAIEREIAILIVDDSPQDAELMCAALSEEGFSVTSRRVQTAEELIRALDDYHDLALCAGTLPWIDPEEALHLVRLRQPGLPFVLVSEPVSEEVIARLMQSGVRNFVPKRIMRLLGPVARRALDSRPTALPDWLYGPLLAREGEAGWRQIASWIDEILVELRAPETTLAIVSFDIDHFHRLNDNLGYEQGEELLRLLEERIALLAHGDRYLGRLRGDEFVVAMERPPREVEGRVQALLSDLRQPFQLATTEMRVNFSAGIALHPENGRDGAMLLREAEAAMREAKRKGRGTCGFASLPTRRLQRAVLEQELLRALERGQFRLEYQPQVELGSGKLLALEALLRWDHPVLGSVPPARFIPLAEESGEITRIGKWVLHTACRDAAAWRLTAGGAEVRVGVNLSARQFLDRDVVGLVERTLEQTGLPPGALELELTEGLLFTDGGEGAGRLRAFRDAGVRIAVDDFGTGYSSLSYLCRFAPDAIKIDRSFVADLVRHARATSVVSTLVELGRRLGIELIAEGVETRQQADALQGLGCGAAQGFLFGRPLRLGEIAALKCGAVAFPNH